MMWQNTGDRPFPNAVAFEGAENGAWFRDRSIRDAASLRRFARAWLDQQIVPVDLPFIRRAYDCAARNDGKGLVDLDREYAVADAFTDLRAAGIRTGVQQLRNLTPLRDQKLLRRYRESVEAGHCSGHHAVVYGVFLHLYSIPLREGLLSYAYQAVNGFIDAASGALSLGPAEARALTDDLCADLPKRIEQSLSIPGPRSTSAEVVSGTGNPRV